MHEQTVEDLFRSSVVEAQIIVPSAEVLFDPWRHRRRTQKLSRQRRIKVLNAGRDIVRGALYLIRCTQEITLHGLPRSDDAEEKHPKVCVSPALTVMEVKKAMTI